MTSQSQTQGEQVRVHKDRQTSKQENGAEHRPESNRSAMLAPNISHWMEEMRRDVESWMNRGLPRLGIRPQGVQMPRTDVSDMGDHYEVLVEVPGVAKKDVELAARDGRLEVHAESQMEREESNRNYYHREIGRRAYHRSLPVPNDGDVENAQGTLENGCLRITIPKRAVEERGKKIPLK